MRYEVTVQEWRDAYAHQIFRREYKTRKNAEKAVRRYTTESIWGYERRGQIRPIFPHVGDAQWKEVKGQE
jgi:hypothetical protein